MEKILIILFILFSNINNIESKEIEMYLEKNENYDLQKLVGKNGFISFIAHYNFDEIKINKTNDKWKPYFELKIYDERNINYYIKCGPWNGGNFLFIFCKFNETFPEGEYTFYYFEKNKNKFNYAGYEINLYQHDANTIHRKKINDEILDLYCPPQTINVTDDEDIYEIIFYIIYYNEEQLYFKHTDEYRSEYRPLNCYRKNKDELICKINKIELMYGIEENNTEIKIYYLNNEGSFIKFNLLSKIDVNFFFKQKTDIYVQITKLIPNDIYIIYETNVTNLPLINAFFILDFIGKENEVIKQCYFKSGEDGKMILLSNKKYSYSDEIYLKEIENNIIINDSSIKYNFIILPVKIKEKTNLIKDDGFEISIKNIYPSVLNFTLNDSLIIDLHIYCYHMPISTEYKLKCPIYINGISFNENAEDLKCINLLEIKRCKVPKEHFNNINRTNDEYYYIKINNNIDFNSKTISYSTNPIRVILPNTNNTNNKSIIKKIIDDNIMTSKQKTAIFITFFTLSIILGAIKWICSCFKKNERKKIIYFDSSNFLGDELEEVIF